MNIKALRAFRITMIEGSIAKASEKMHLSQSAISRLISSLEGELKLDLFLRSGRRLIPTQQALAFDREARRILDNLDEIKRIADEIRTAQTQRLRVLAMPRVAPTLVSPTVKRFLEEHSDVHLSVDVRTHRDAEQWLLGREYDLGIGPLPINHPDISSEVLLKVRAAAILPLNHPLCDKTEINASDLKDEAMIALLPHLLLRTQMEDFFHSAGQEKAFACEVASSQLACFLVADGAGITIADSLTAKIVDNQVVTRPIVPERWMSFGILYPKSVELSSAAKEFIALLKADLAHLESEHIKIEK
ncbi:LysR family transcriptional regulator [Parashewanella tropica]|uniref:LysR family transcriptional regulator n=1 Tax=Parashewanella tropica TaxID=2547970 RepID=UPI00105A1E86|nr:LysR family transcriptional regulator [Parashewanella tropica]